MKRFALLVAAVTSALNSVPVAAQPRGRTTLRAQPGQGGGPPARETADDDGAEAKGAALFKLDDVIEVAVRLSPDIARARADREIAQGAAGAARKEQSWILSAEASYQRQAIGGDSPEDAALQVLGTLKVIAEDQVNGTVGLGRKLPTGGTLGVEVGLTHVRRELFITGEQVPTVMDNQPLCGENIDVLCLDQATAKLTLTQPLSRGLGSDVALAAERRADLSAAEETVKAQLAAEEMIRDLVIAYWELAFAANEVDVRAESLELARKQDQMTRQEMRAGTATQNALDAVTYEIAVRDEALLTAKLEFEKKSLDLRRKAGLEIGRRDIVVRPSEPFEIGNQDWNVDDVLARSHKVNRQLARVALEKKIADVDVALAHDATLPQIDLNLSGAVLGNGDTPGAAFSGLAGDSNSTESKHFGYQVLAGVKMSFELSGAAKAGQSAALAKRHRLDIDRVDLERQIDAEVVSSVKALMAGRTRVALTDKAIAVAEENVKAEKASFLAQRSNNFNVMQRQTQLIDARLRRGRAVADYHIAVARLRFLSGSLLDTYRIRVRAQGREG